MTEAEWLACDDPEPMLVFLGGRPSERKVRLFACACCRRLGHLFLADECRQAVEVAERFADGGASEEQLRQAHRLASRAHDAFRWRAHAAPFAATQHPLWREEDGVEPAGYAWLASTVRTASLRPDGSEVGGEGQAQADLLRCVLGNPFRPPPSVNPAWLAWEAGTVPKLAAAAYEERAFERLPVLADALEEAGCAEAELLGHLRGPGPHARGCWALDLLLGKT
jgi:hypothetical protein